MNTICSNWPLSSFILKKPKNGKAWMKILIMWYQKVYVFVWRLVNSLLERKINKNKIEIRHNFAKNLNHEKWLWGSALQPMNNLQHVWVRSESFIPHSLTNAWKIISHFPVNLFFYRLKPCIRLTAYHFTTDDVHKFLPALLRADVICLTYQNFRQLWASYKNTYFLLQETPLVFN